MDKDVLKAVQCCTVRDAGLSEWPVEVFCKTYGQYEWLQKNHDKAPECYREAVEWCEWQYGKDSTSAKLVVAPTTPSLRRRTPDADIRYYISTYLCWEALDYKRLKAN